ncbi:MAG TPA: ATP-binding protein [Steroidobacteraceae bacterium]|nr:ATP-binding protein [Steroidobacteraceae bacterium]
MERWRIFGLTTLLCVAFLASLFLIAEAGRVRLRDASEAMQAAMARRILVGELRQQVAESSLATRSFLLTGRPEYLEPLKASGRDINRTADAFVTSYADEPPEAAETARQLRYLAGMHAGATLSLISLYTSRGAAAARELARAQAPAVDPLGRFIAVADKLEDYEGARMTETRANWQREQRLARQLALAGTLVTIALVVSASLMALSALRRHRDGMAQVERRKDELEHEATTRAAELSEVYGHLQTVQEQERSRLARGLHDELGGLLLAARMDVTWVKQHARDATPDALAARIERILDVLDQGIDLKRRVIEELRPTLLDNMGLLAAIQWQADETCKRGRLHCTCHFPAQEPEVDAHTAIALFRVVQEALTNVQKHANASRVDVTLDLAADHVLLAIVDDGRGIGTDEFGKAQSHGLAGMKHRVVALGGTLSVGRSPEGGTEVRAIVPRGPVGESRAPSSGAALPRANVSRLMGRSS